MRSCYKLLLIECFHNIARPITCHYAIWLRNHSLISIHPLSIIYPLSSRGGLACETIMELCYAASCYNMRKSMQQHRTTEFSLVIDTHYYVTPKIMKALKCKTLGAILRILCQCACAEIGHALRCSSTRGAVSSRSNMG